jgi:hypothetical protein
MRTVVEANQRLKVLHCSVLAACNRCLTLHKPLTETDYVAQVSVYTFGAPRVGNHAFARVYEKAVPDTWHVINDQVILYRLDPARGCCTHQLSSIATALRHRGSIYCITEEVYAPS